MRIEFDYKHKTVNINEAAPINEIFNEISKVLTRGEMEQWKIQTRIEIVTKEPNIYPPTLVPDNPNWPYPTITYDFNNTGK